MSRQEVQDENIGRPSRFNFHGCPVSRDGRIAPGSYRERREAHQVDVEIEVYEQPDPLNDGRSRQRYGLTLVINSADPLIGHVNDYFIVGRHRGPSVDHIVRPEQFGRPRLRRNPVNPLELRLPLGAQPHLCHVFLASKNGIKLRYADREERAVLAFANLGAAYRFDHGMSNAIEQYLNQGEYLETSALANETEGVILGPAGKMAVSRLFYVLNDNNEAQDAALLAGTLRRTGIDISQHKALLDYANVIVALQWPEAFKRWNACLDLSAERRVPATPIELVQLVLKLESKSERANGLDELALWQAFRSGESGPV